VKNLGVSTPVAGAGLALAAGLTLGAAMRPQLAIGELSPQPLDAWPQAASAMEPAPDPLAFAQYGGQPPQFMIGADWPAGTAPPAGPEPDVQDRDQPSRNDEAARAAPAEATPATAQAPADANAAHPAQDAPAEAAPAPPPIPALAVDEAAPPPEATGDTSLPEP